MKVLMINTVCGIGSTGRICTDIAASLEAQGHEVKIAYGREKVPEQYQKYAIHIGSNVDVALHGLRARLIDGCGFGSKQATKRFIKWVKEYNPDVIHLHNLHGYYINIEVLFNYLKVCGKKVLWTLHDCWAFTGHCTYFDYAGCDRWKNLCKDCLQQREYPVCRGLDRSKRNYLKKRQLFTDIKDFMLITPSEWLAKLVKQSFLSEYAIEVIHNGVDTAIFKPTVSNLRDKFCLKDKKIILGVASNWEKRKGLRYFIELSELLTDEYRIILVGLESKQINILPEKIIGIARTNSTQELAALYTMADVFVNPTLEDNFPTTNLEAIACGTPVVTFDTGGSPESAKLYGVIVPKGDIHELTKAIEVALQLEKCEMQYEISKEHMSHLYMMLYENNT